MRGGNTKVQEKELTYRYEIIMNFITDLIHKGTLRAGMRAPSLREMATQHKVSITTVQQAYRLLEDRAVLEARPKSGFFVTQYSQVFLDKPALSTPPNEVVNVEISDRIFDLITYINDPKLVPLGCAIPSTEILASSQLDRFLARNARVKGKQHNVYSEPRGYIDLRVEISRRAMRWGQSLSPDDIGITCGCTEALYIALRTVTNPGDVVAIESPTYFGLLLVLESLGLKTLELPTDASDGIEIEALATALKSKSIKTCLFASSFNNPLGCTMSEDKKKAVLDLMIQHDVTLIEDDIYGDIHFGSERPKPFIALNEQADVIYCSSFSKTIAPGYRIGWIATSKHMQKVLKEKFAITLCTPVLLQAALADFLKSGGYDSHLRRIRRSFTDNIDRMTRSINLHFPKDTLISRPSGGFVLWLELSADVDSRQIFTQALQEGICIAPGDMFSTSDNYKNFIRLSCGYSWNEKFEKSIKTLSELVR